MNKIRFFFLQVLFLCTPLVYAWLYIPYIQGNLADIAQPTLLNINLFLAFITQPFLSLPFIGSLFFNTFTEVHWSWFESTKVSFMLFTTAIVLCFSVLPLLRSKIKIDKTFLIGVLIVAVWAVCSYILNKDTNPYFFSGNPEKTHGLYFSLALFMLFWVLFSLSKVEKKNLLFVSFIAFFGVALYAFFQKLGLDPLRQLYNTRLDLWRIFSTLGNPNYLAGYVLMILPLLRVYRFKNELSWQEHLWEVFVWVLSGVLIYWTGSYLAWVLFAGYVGYVIVEHLISDRKQRRIFWIFFGIFLMFAISWVWHNYQSEILAAQKMKGFIARWYLWYTGIAALKHDVWHFLFGFGPDGFLSVSAKFRHPLLSVYEDPAYRIDRSHNVFIDFALNFWVPLSLIIFWFIADSLKHLSHDKKVSLFIFALYFSFNIPVIVHFLLLIQIFSSIEKPR